jgi:hypothetical protein
MVIFRLHLRTTLHFPKDSSHFQQAGRSIQTLQLKLLISVNMALTLASSKTTQAFGSSTARTLMGTVNTRCGCVETSKSRQHQLTDVALLIMIYATATQRLKSPLNAHLVLKTFSFGSFWILLSHTKSGAGTLPHQRCPDELESFFNHSSSLLTSFSTRMASLMASTADRSIS